MPENRKSKEEEAVESLVQGKIGSDERIMATFIGPLEKEVKGYDDLESVKLESDEALVIAGYFSTRYMNFQGYYLKKQDGEWSITNTEQVHEAGDPTCRQSC